MSKKRSGADWASLVTGLGLGLTVALQIETTTKEDWASTYAIITSVSRSFALIGTYLALVGLVLVARVPWIETSVGHDRLVTWHRKLGPYSLFLIGFHVLFVAFGYAGLERIPTIVELWRMVTRFPWMLPAFIGFIFMMAAGVTSYKKARAKMSYETWWTVHLYTYLAIALSFMHQVLTGPMFIGHPLNRFFWNVLYLLVAGTLITWRFAIPVIRSLRLGLKVEQVVNEGPGVFSIIMKGRNVDSLGAQGGQFFGWRFLTKGHWFISHPYSLSAAPTKKYLRVTVKDLGDHSGSVTFIKPGTRVFLEGPYGAFTAGRASKGHVTLIGGGVGITPIRAIMEEFPPNVEVDVIFRASNKEDLVLKEELDYLAQERGARVHYLIGPRSEHPMDAKYLMRVVPTFRDSDVYICGPTPLVDAVREAARNVGIPKNRFHDEAFAFHGE
ncbi:MAG: ferric reductase-like transmembrane domain-containing protein [Acidobacteria bacterium]|nr:ferric reductase-like transmembrane domain-containing protein [Acidobacteriota bacterium]